MIERTQRSANPAVKTSGRKATILMLNLVFACLVTVQIVGAFGIAIVNDTNTTIGQFLLFWVKK